MKQAGNTFAKSCIVVFLWCLGTISVIAAETDSLAAELDYERARWHPIHFKPAIETATNEQCLECHQDILNRKVKEQSPAGVQSANALAWYQTLDTYKGEQDTFHRRHLESDFTKKMMDLQCNFCHQGNDPREEAPIPPTSNDAGFTLRKVVNPEKTCLKCHGRHNYEIMGLTGPWEETREMMGDSCLTCHVAIRTNRHQVNYLNAEEIETAGQENSDVCYGCHGGRQWYRITYPYPRHPWPGMAEEVPDWAQDRPTESEERFRLAAAADDESSSSDAPPPAPEQTTELEPETQPATTQP